MLILQGSGSKHAAMFECSLANAGGEATHSPADGFTAFSTSSPWSEKIHRGQMKGMTDRLLNALNKISASEMFNEQGLVRLQGQTLCFVLH